MGLLGTLLVAVGIAIGLVGILLPVLPGLLLICSVITVWALVEQTATGWVVVGAAVLLAACAQVLKFALPGRSMSRRGVPQRSLITGAAAGVVGFFALPLLGLPLGFVAGVYLAERARLGTHESARGSTVQACRAVGLSIAIELGAGLLIAAIWFVAAVAALI